MVDGQTVITSGTGRGTRAYRVGAAEATEVWANPDVAAEFNTPVVKDGLVYGLTARDELFCLDAKTGKTAWTTPVKGWNRPGYGSVVDAGTVLMALTPAGRLLVFAPSDKEFKQVASYPVAGGDTFAYPVADGNRIYVKDKNAVTLWTTE